MANVGDSGFIILRHGTVYKRSSPMLHAFHFPLLFGKEDEPSHVSEVCSINDITKLKPEFIHFTSKNSIDNMLLSLCFSSTTLI